MIVYSNWVQLQVHHNVFVLFFGINYECDDEVFVVKPTHTEIIRKTTILSKSAIHKLYIIYTHKFKQKTISPTASNWRI